MKDEPILMLAPEPVLQPRGTPLSVHHRLAALSELGYRVDLLTYPLGEEFALEGVNVLRLPCPPGLRRIRIGLSPEKLLLDAEMTVVAARLLRAKPYRALHSHEESVFIAAALAKAFDLPHLYDMHSSLPKQLDEWGPKWAAPLAALGRPLERRVLASADVVVTVCPSLADHVARIAPATECVLIENTRISAAVGDGAAARRRHGVEGRRLVVYTGNAEAYQGVELLVDAMGIVAREIDNAHLLLVGIDEVAAAPILRRVEERGIAEGVTVVERVAPDEVANYLAAADVLVSPRMLGDGTPLKLYAYLAAGKPIVATDIAAHTQIIDPSVACLVPTNAAAMGAAIAGLLGDRDRAETLATAAQHFADEHLDRSQYRDRVAAAYRALLGD